MLLTCIIDFHSSRTISDHFKTFINLVENRNWDSHKTKNQSVFINWCIDGSHAKTVWMWLMQKLKNLAGYIPEAMHLQEGPDIRSRIFATYLLTFSPLMCAIHSLVTALWEAVTLPIYFLTTVLSSIFITCRIIRETFWDC